LTNYKKLRHAIERFMGKPYVLGACGEGEQGRYDQHPLYREDAFDCLTYVNSVLALALSESPDTVVSKLLLINYTSDEISYFSRCHFMLSDWLPNNMRAGRLAWITEKLGLETTTVTRDFDRGWFFRQRTKRDLHLLEPVSKEQEELLIHELQNGGPKGVLSMSVTYCEWGQMLKNQKQLQVALPPISLMLVVRPSEADAQSCSMVSHLGFILNEGGELFFVHAKHQESVQRERLSVYLERFEDHALIKGASFLEILI
jgi:hypothetical protein